MKTQLLSIFSFIFLFDLFSSSFFALQFHQKSLFLSVFSTQNCVDKSDEVDCPNSDIVLQVYPERTSVRQGHEVVFRCRDEGAMHLDVRWSREGGAPLPVGSLDLKGRLTLLNVQTNYSGVYVCSVAEEHQQTFRAVKAAFLTVLPSKLDGKECFPQRNYFNLTRLKLIISN